MLFCKSFFILVLHSNLTTGEKIMTYNDLHASNLLNIKLFDLYDIIKSCNLMYKKKGL